MQRLSIVSNIPLNTLEGTARTLTGQAGENHVSA